MVFLWFSHGLPKTYHHGLEELPPWTSMIKKRQQNFYLQAWAFLLTSHTDLEGKMAGLGKKMGGEKHI